MTEIPYDDILINAITQSFQAKKRLWTNLIQSALIQITIDHIISKSDYTLTHFRENGDSKIFNQQEKSIQRDIFTLLFAHAQAFGSEEFKRIHRESEGSMTELNKIGSYGGKNLRELITFHFPFPKEYVYTSYEPVHKNISLDFAELIRPHFQKLFLYLFIHDVPTIIASRILNSFFRDTLP